MSDSSGLSSAPPSDDEAQKTQKTLTLKNGKLTAGRPRKSNVIVEIPRKSNVRVQIPPEHSPSPPPREPSPPHEYALADNADIAVLVTFRARFQEAFGKHVPHIGPQDIETGITGDEPSEQVEVLLCALLVLVLNRKKIIERGHHGRALEEAISSQKSQWPTAWAGINPLHGNQSFATMSPIQRLTLLKTLVIWSLNTSEVIGGIIRESYKQARREDDVNQPLSVQSWGSDGRKRRYWLIEGQNDTPFRVYIENQPKLIKRTWWSVAGTLEELKTISEDLIREGGQADRRMAERITASVPRLEQSEEKRKRRDYKKTRRAAFTRPEPGFSLYEGRTRGKRMRYTYSDDDDEGSDAPSTRRSTRQSDISTPAENQGPTVTLSGRQVRSRFARTYGETLDTTTNTTTDGVSGEGSEASTRLRGGTGGPRRSNRAYNTDQPRATRGKGDYESIDDLDEEDEAASTGNEWGGDDEDIEGKLDDDDEEEERGDEEDDEESVAGADEVDDPQSLIVQLKYGKDKQEGSAQETGYTEKDGLGVSTDNTAASSSNHKPADLPDTANTEDMPRNSTERRSLTPSLPQQLRTTYPESTVPQSENVKLTSPTLPAFISKPKSNASDELDHLTSKSTTTSYGPVNGNGNGIHVTSPTKGDAQQIQVKQQ